MSHRNLCLFIFALVVMTTLLLNLQISSSADNYIYLIVGSESMRPTFDTNTFITVRRDVAASSINAAPYPNGDIIVFYLPKSSSADKDQFVAHRAVANLTRTNGLTYFSTRGDANSAADSWTDYRGEDYSWNGMISEYLLVGKVVSYGKNYQSSPSQTLGRYTLYQSDFTANYNRTVQQLRDSGIEVQGDPTRLINVNLTYLGYTGKITIVDIDWPETTTRFLEGEHNTNLTGYPIMENGSLGDLAFSQLQMNQPARLGNAWTGHDPAFGLGFNPTAFVIGNSFQTDSSESALRFTVDRSEVLMDTPWRENQTYVLDGYFANETHCWNWTIWCDAESGLVLKQIANSTTPQLIAYEELHIIETGIELIVPKKEIPTPENSAAALVVGTSTSVGLSALTSTLAASQSAGQAGSILAPLRDAANRFFKFHSERTIEKTDEESAGLSKRSRKRKEIERILLSALISSFAFAVVEVNGLPNLLSLSAFAGALVYVPVFLVSTGAITTTRGLFGAISNRLFQVRIQSRIWIYGIVALILSSLIFLVPFGAVYATEYKSDNNIKKTKSDRPSRNLLIVSKTSLTFTLLAFFSLPLLRDLTTLGDLGKFLVLAGDAGVLIITMTAFFQLLPFYPLEGKTVWNRSKKAWFGIIVLPAAFFVCYIYQLLPPSTFLIAGIISACIFAATLFLARKRKHEHARRISDTS